MCQLVTQGVEDGKDVQLVRVIKDRDENVLTNECEGKMEGVLWRTDELQK